MGHQVIESQRIVAAEPRPEPADERGKPAQPTVTRADIVRTLRGGRFGRFLRMALWLLVLAGAGYGVWRYMHQEEAPISYRTEAVDRGDIRTTVSATGSLQPRRTILVGAEVSGKIASVEVQDNDTVTAGQVLARFDTESLESRVKQAEAQLAVARASVTRARATRDESKLAVDRIRTLANRGSAPRQELESAEASATRAGADLVSNKAQVEQAEAALEQARAELGRAVITSPVDGVVLLRKVEPGNTVSSSLQAPELFLVAESLQQMELRVAVDEADVGRVEPGQKASFSVDAWPSERFRATVESVRLYPNEDTTVVTYEAVLSVDNEKGLLRPGMTATANITTGGVEDVLRVSNVALRFQPPSQDAQEESAASSLVPGPRMRGRRGGGGGGRSGGNSVWVERDGELVQIPLELGMTDGRYTEVTGGELEAGDEVIIGVDGPVEAPAAGGGGGGRGGRR